MKEPIKTYVVVFLIQSRIFSSVYPRPLSSILPLIGLDEKVRMFSHTRKDSQDIMLRTT